MIVYTLRRIGYGALVMALVTVMVFFIMNLVPGDVVTLQLQSASGVTAEQAEALRASFGLDQPAHVQFWNWVRDAARGDFGESFWSGESVTSMFARRVPITLQLGFIAIATGTVIGLILGIVSAVRRGGLADNAIRVASVAGLSVPNFVVGLLLLTGLAIWFQWSPPFVYRGPTQDFTSWWQHMLLPAIALGTASFAGITRLTRSAMIEALGSDYIRTVRAKGAPERVVQFKHALRNSTIAVLTLLGVQLGTILGGTVILEQLFSLPGTGSMIFDAVINRDYPVVVATTVFYAGLFVSVIIVIDLLYAVVDPRIRTGEAAS